MAFWESAQETWTEVQEARDRLDEFVGDDYEEWVKNYATSGYRTDWDTDEDDRENKALEWITNFLSLVAVGTPRITTKTNKKGVAGFRSKALRHAQNQSLVETKWKELSEKLFVDWGLRWGVAITSPAPLAGLSDFDDPVYRPVSKRVPLKHYLHDTLSLEASEDRWRGHVVIRDKDEVLEEARENEHLGWNLDMLLSMNEEESLDQTARDKRNQIKRGEIAYVEIWVPDYHLDKGVTHKGRKFKPKRSKGYNGTILTLPYGKLYSESDNAKSTPEEWLRKPRPFWGPREGPYTVGGVMIVPDHSEPLSMVAATRPQADELNNHRRALSTAMANFKKGVAVDAAAGDDLAEVLVEFLDQGIFQLEGVDELQKHIKEISMFGATPEQMHHFDFLSARYDANSGISEAQRGNPSGESTATAAAISNQFGTRRSSFIVGKWTDFAEAVISKEMWYLDRDDRMVVEIPEAQDLYDPETGAPIGYPVYQGGGEVVEDYGVSIELYSISQTSEEREFQKSQERLNLFTVVAQQMITTPHVVWRKYVEEEAERLEDPDLPKYFDFNILGQMQAMALQSPEPVQAQPSPSSSPMLRGDLIPAKAKISGFAAKANLTGSGQGNGSMSMKSPVKETSE